MSLRRHAARLWWHPITMKWGRLSMLAIAIFVVWSFFHWGHERTIRDDKWLSSLVATTWLIAILLSLVITRRYTMRSLGTFGTVLGGVLLYGSFMVALWQWFSPPEWIQELLRACFVVGAPLMMLGMVWDTWLWWKSLSNQKKDK